MATALVSALAKIPVRRDVAMTGEITLRGRVLPIGGLKEKTLAAHRAGMKTVLIPKQNRKDLRDIPKKIRDQLRIVPVEYVDDVLREALLLEKPEEFFRKPGAAEPDQVPSAPPASA
jgi:ATP-dependent Lon protease